MTSTHLQSLPHRLERSVVIKAEPTTVFNYFTDTARWASWWGSGSTIEAEPGGRVLICFPGGVQVSGEVVEIRPPEQIVMTYGFVSGAPMPAGSSLVTIRLEPIAGGATRLHLVHAFADAAVRDEHVQGWRYQLSLFGNIVADEVHADTGALVDGWFAAWSDPEATTRETTMKRIATADVRFGDRFSVIDGMADLLPQLAAIHRFMPGLRLEREGVVRHCQGMVLADWVARSAGGQERGRGTNVFLIRGGNAIESVTGFWSRPAGS